MGSMAIPVNSKSEGPLPQSIYCQMSPLIKFISEQNAMIVDKVSVALSETLQRGNTHTKIFTVYFSKKIVLFILQY